MSQIINQITASATGMRYAEIPSPLLVTHFKEQKTIEHDYLTEYYLGVNLGHKVKINDEVPGQREEALRIMRRAITELIFGEFRPLLSELSYQLYDRDLDKAKETADKIQKRMFYD